MVYNKGGPEPTPILSLRICQFYLSLSIRTMTVVAMVTSCSQSLFQYFCPYKLNKQEIHALCTFSKHFVNNFHALSPVHSWIAYLYDLCIKLFESAFSVPLAWKLFTEYFENLLSAYFLFLCVKLADTPTLYILDGK